jgi:protein TonB
MEGTHLNTPRRIPLQVAHITEDVAPPTFAPSDGDAVVGSTGPVGNVVGAVPDLLAKNFEAAPKLEIARPTRVSPGVMAGHLVHEVKPVYPHIAIITRVQGSVILHATISKTGYIENLRAVSGPPMLMRAAIDAVQQWRYRPYMLGNEPVEVETQITVNFTLSNSY